jgi:hypothetical protein
MAEFKCPCGKSFKYNYLLEKHINAFRPCNYIKVKRLEDDINNNDDQVKCNICNKTISNKYNLQRHLLTCETKNKNTNENPASVETKKHTKTKTPVKFGKNTTLLGTLLNQQVKYSKTDKQRESIANIVAILVYAHEHNILEKVIDDCNNFLYQIDENTSDIETEINMEPIL